MQFVYGQSSVRALNDYFVKLRSNSSEPVPPAILTDTKNSDKILQSLSPYLNDSLNTIRSRAHSIAKRIGEKSDNQVIRRQVVTILTTSLKDKDSGIVGNSLEGLTNFRLADFNDAIKDSIGIRINTKTPHLDELLKLAGYLQLQKYTSYIEAIINTNIDASVKWAARLALSRMGDERSIQYIVGKIEKAKVNDDFVYEVVPDLVYTRQPPIFKFLERIINSDEANCLSANPDSEVKILCGYRVMEYVASAIKSFPVQVDESGDLVVSNYKKALEDVRQWLKANPNYEILSASY